LTGCAGVGDDASGNASDTSDAITEKTKIRIAGMKGPTSIGLVGIMENDANGVSKNDYEFSIKGAADEITPLLLKGELDIAAVPANLASVLYNRTKGKIKLLAINNLGVLYIVAKGGEITSLADLKGKTILATGKGTTPEYTLRHILAENGIDPDKDVTLDFKTEATEVVSLMAKSETAIAMLPQPYVTVASGKIEGLKTVIDLNDEWKKINENNGIVTGVIVARDEFVNENPEAVKAFLEEFENSVNMVNSDVKTSASLVEKFGIFAADVAEKAIPKCNITYVAGADMKPLVNTYLGVLHRENPNSVGGKLPNDDFYYIAK
jgi:NitT/TauT family transport system substrate-binding protein